MNKNGKSKTHEERQSLWLLTLSPLIWALHFMICYITAAVWIEKVGGRNAELMPVRIAIAAYTVVALAGIFWVLWIGYRRHNHGDGSLPHDEDTAADRHRFLGFATLIISGLSAIATVYTALAAVFIPTTH